MTSTPHKLLALCLAWLLLLAPLGNVMAAFSVPPGQDMHEMHMSAASTGSCADCPQHADSAKHKICCEGTSCALMGGCGACAATFQAMRLPERVALGSALSANTCHSVSSHDPDTHLRPPRA